MKRISFLRIILPRLLNVYSTQVRKHAEKGDFTHPNGWLVSANVADELSNLLK